MMGRSPPAGRLPNGMCFSAHPCFLPVPPPTPHPHPSTSAGPVLDSSHGCKLSRTALKNASSASTLVGETEGQGTDANPGAQSP